MAAYERVTLNRGGRNSRFDCTLFSDIGLRPTTQKRCLDNNI